MKYNELHRRLRKAGCYPTGGEMVTLNGSVRLQVRNLPQDIMEVLRWLSVRFEIYARHPA